MTDGKTLSSFGASINAAVFGATGGLGRAFVAHLAADPCVAGIAAFSRGRFETETPKAVHHSFDLEQEETIAAAVEAARPAGGFHLVIVATGILHEDDLQPEKTWRALDGAAMERLFRLNTIGPALIAKHVLPLLAKDRKAIFAAVSARVGSIGDNALGGWYAYRASKAALNMTIKSLSIELTRRNAGALCVGLHPGTVDTALSAPFQGGVPSEKLFTPAQSAGYLLVVLDRLTPADTGCVFAWDGQPIPD